MIIGDVTAIGGSVDTLRLAMDAIFSIEIVIVSYISFSIKSSVTEIKLEQARVKAALIEQQSATKEQLLAEQSRIKEELNQKLATIDQARAVHVAEDELNFRSIREALSSLPDLVKSQIAQETQFEVHLKSTNAVLAGLADTYQKHIADDKANFRVINDGLARVEAAIRIDRQSGKPRR